MSSNVLKGFSGITGVLGGALMSMASLGLWVYLTGTALKYLQHVMGLNPFQPDWLNYLVGALIPPVLPIGIVLFGFNLIGHLLFGTAL